MKNGKQTKRESSRRSSSFNDNSVGEAMAAITADDKWIFEQFNQGKLEKYAGEYVVVFNKQVVAHHPKYHLAQKKAANQLPEVSVKRFAISYIDMLN